MKNLNKMENLDKIKQLLEKEQIKSVSISETEKEMVTLSAFFPMLIIKTKNYTITLTLESYDWKRSVNW